MSARACLRGLAWMAQDAINLFWPTQLADAMRSRDFDAAAGRAADALNEFEAARDGLDGGELPDYPGPRAEDAEEEVWDAHPTWQPSHPKLARFWAPGSFMHGAPIPASLCATEGKPCNPLCGECDTTRACPSCGRADGQHRSSCARRRNATQDPLAASAPNPRSDVAGVGPAAGLSPRPAAGLSTSPLAGWERELIDPDYCELYKLGTVHDVLIEHGRVAVLRPHPQPERRRIMWGCRCDRQKPMTAAQYVDHVMDELQSKQK